MFCRQLRKLGEQELLKPKKDRKNIIIRISSFGGGESSIRKAISDNKIYKGYKWKYV